jgi:hypothetical protein
MLSHEDQTRIVASDRARRAARDAAELEQFARAIEGHGPSSFPDATGDYAPSEIIAGASVVTPPRDVRVTARGTRSRAGSGYWSDVTVRDAHRDPILLAQLGTRGIATGTDVGDGTATVRVIHADGSTEIRSAASFRRAAVARRRSRATAAPVQHRTTARDLPGDVDIAQGS